MKEANEEAKETEIEKRLEEIYTLLIRCKNSETCMIRHNFIKLNTSSAYYIMRMNASREGWGEGSILFKLKKKNVEPL